MPDTDGAANATGGGTLPPQDANNTDTNTAAGTSTDDKKNIVKKEITYSKTLLCRTKLDFHGKNYIQWKSIIPAYLKQDEEIWDVIKGKVVPPEAPKTGEMTADQKAQYAKYQKIADRARLLIIDSLDEKLVTKLFYGITETATPSMMWTLIAKEFNNQESLCQRLVMTKFLRFKFNPHMNIQDNLNAFSRLQTEASEAGVSIDPKIQIQTLLQSLPPVWNPVLLSWATREEPDKSIDKLIDIIKAEAIRMYPEKEVTRASAMLSQMKIRPGAQRRGGFRRRGTHNRRFVNQVSSNAPGPSTQHRGPRPNTQNVRCYNCGGTGHFKNQCRKPKRTNGQASQQARDKAHRPRAHIAEAFMMMGQMHAYEDDYEYDIFIIDSGATDHLVKSKDWYETFSESCDTREVRLGSSDKLPVRGTGDARLTVMANEGIVDIDLKNVLYVPGLRKNLLSISKLTANGFKINFSENILTIEKDGIIIMVPKEKGLYKMRLIDERDQRDLTSHYAPEEEQFLKDRTDSDSDEEENPPRRSLAALAEEDKYIETSDKKNHNETGKFSLKEMHERLGHIGKTNLIHFIKGMKGKYIDDLGQCNTCVMAKQRRSSYRSKPDEAKAKEPGTIIADLCYMPVASHDGGHHFLLLTDEYSKFRKVYILENKFQTIKAVKHYVSWFRNIFGKDITRFHSDRGTEFKNQKIRKLMNSIGAEQTFSNPQTPQQTGVAERGNLTLLQTIKTMLLATTINEAKFLWAEAAKYAVELWNMLTLRKDTKISAYEIFYKKKPYIRKFHEFGTPVSVHNKYGDKLDINGSLGIFVGLLPHGLGYKVFLPEENEFVDSKDVVFLKKLSDKEQKEFKVIMKRAVEANKEGQRFTVSGETIADDDSDTDTDSDADANTAELKDPREGKKRIAFARKENSQPWSGIANKAPEKIRSSLSNPDEQDFTSRNDNEPDAIGVTCNLPLREQKNSIDALVHETYHSLKEEVENNDGAEKAEPASYNEAMSSPEKEQWLAAIKEELQTMESLKAWRVVDLPPGRKTIDTKWVLRKKCPPNGPVRYRARLVARGFRQREGVDFATDEIYSPTARSDSIRTVLSIAAEKGLCLKQFDVAAAFVQAELEDDVYIQIPQGVTNVPRGKVLKLQRALYGLRQSSYVWNRALSKVIMKLGLRPTDSDPCVFARHGDEMVIVCVYVDDGMIAAKNEKVALKFIEELRKLFKVSSGELNYFLGLQIEVDQDNNIFVHQAKYANEIVKRFKVEYSRPASTPCDPSIYKIDPEGPATKNDFRSLIGSLLFLSCGTRPDICFATAYLSRFLDRCTEEHWEAGIRVLKYIKGCPNLGIKFKSNSKEGTMVYSDADFASDSDRKSTSGTLITRQEAPIIWRTSKQSTVATSSAESELIAAAETLKLSMWLTNFLKELKIEELHCMFIDNLACISLIKKQAAYKRVKHIEISCYMIRDRYQKGLIKIQHCPSKELKSDFLTKPSRSVGLFQKQRTLAGLEKWQA